MLIDTHCHLDFKDFDADRDEVIERAVKAGVGAIINVGSSVEGSRRAVELSRRYDMVYATLGVHPHEADSVTDKVLDEFKALSEEKKVVAVGEVGLDYFRNLSPRTEQVSGFKKFIHLADELDLPLIIHARETSSEILDILKKEKKGEMNAVMHCFSGDERFLKDCIAAGLYVSFTCNITFKNAKVLKEVARSMPVDRLLLETDAPFLAPQEFRGKRNEPSYLTYLLDEWSNILGLSKEDIAKITTHNANVLFGLNMEETPKITYEIRDSLYLNITNACTNECDFCVRNETPFVKGHNLKLDRDPSPEEIIKAIGDTSKYREVVFCGYGEPTLRLDVIRVVAGELKKRGLKIRVVTNGHGDIINKRPIAKELAGLVDKVSVSLNSDSAESYNFICKPKIGPDTYKGILDFIKSCISNNIETEVTCLDMKGVDVKKCEAIAKSLGAKFRLRRLGVVG